MADSFRFDEYQDSFSASFAPDSTGSVWEEIAKGDPGKGLEFSGLVADASELPQDVELYTMYLVGAEAPYTIYMLNVTGWVDLGTYQGPKGDTGVTPNFTIGSVITINPGAQAHATITGTAENPVLNLYIPRGNPGATGATPAFSIGLVTTGNPGTSAQASITGTAAAPVLNLTIPRGDRGAVPESVTSKSGNQMIAAGASGTVSWTATKQGYFPIGIVGWRVGWVSGSTASINVSRVRLQNITTGSVTIDFGIYNPASSSVEFFMEADVLWMEE